MSAVADAGAPPALDALRSRGYWSQSLRRLARQPLTVAALAVAAAVLAAGALAPQLAPQGVNALDLGDRWRNHGPILQGWHLLGTDNIGRDVLVRLLYAVHVSEQSALLAALLASVLGVAVGAAAGVRGGWLDVLLMRAADLVTSFPALMLFYAAYILIYQFFLRPVTVADATLLFGLYLWAPVARVVRASVASLRGREFIEAARALGASRTRILFRHMLPNAAGVAIVAATSVVGQVLALEATLEFFGLGVPSQVEPTLGNLIGDATSSGIGPYNDLNLGWWTWGFPAATLALLILCINLAGDGLDTALNPAARR